MPGLGTKSGTVHQIGLSANRPIAEPSLEGYTYFSTDVNGGTLYWCDGTTWIQITAGLRTITAGSNVSVVSNPTTITISSSSPLPIASASVLGGIKVGTGLFIDAGGVLSTTYTYTLPTASGSVLGGIKVGTGLTIDEGGVLSANSLTDTITFVINGGGTTIATGVVGDLLVPFNCTISQVTLLADQTTNAVIDVWKTAYSGFPPTVTNKITASAPPTITASNKSQDTTLTGWTTAISSGDVLRFNVNSCSAAQLITISLRIIRS